MDPEMKKYFDEIGANWKAYREANDARMAAIEKGQGHAEIDAKLAALDASLVEAKAQLNRLALGTALGGNQASRSQMVTELVGWMRDPSRAQLFKGQVNTTTNADGGYLVVPEIDSVISRIAAKNVAMRSLANVKTIGRPSYVKNVNKGGVTAGWVAEGGSRTGNTGTPAFAQIEIFARELYTLPSATSEALEDMEFDVAAWLAEEAGIMFGETEDLAFIQGDGSSKPKGFLGYDIVANASYEWGKIGYVASGAAADFATTNPSDKLVDLIHALKAKYRANGNFLLNDLTLAKIRKFKDGQGNYLWQPSFQMGQPDRLSGYPVAVSDNMPDVAADAYAVAFGDFNAGYQIVDRRGVKVLADPYTTKGVTTFYTTKRCGGDVVNFEAIKVLKIAAS